SLFFFRSPWFFFCCAHTTHKNSTVRCRLPFSTFFLSFLPTFSLFSIFLFGLFFSSSSKAPSHTTPSPFFSPFFFLSRILFLLFLFPFLALFPTSFVTNSPFFLNFYNDQSAC
ncbi:hypothetical protein BC940DRAFT_270758, partial [Gongronella butleri]